MATFLVMLTCACGGARDPALGKWKTTDGAETMELFAGGKGLVAEGSGSAMSLEWRRVDERRLILTLTLGLAASACIAGDAMEVRMAGSRSLYVRQRADGLPAAVPDTAKLTDCPG